MTLVFSAAPVHAPVHTEILTRGPSWLLRVRSWRQNQSGYLSSRR
jgi:hypothetical protein